MKRAILIGATGLIGKQLLKQLLNHNGFSEVRVFTRRTTGVHHPKLKEFIIDFDAIESQAGDISGDVLFSVLGTTLKTAGSKDEQYKIDYGYQHKTAEIAAKNGVRSLVLLSSTGANAQSNVFYSRMKGELDHAVKALPFEHISILRPSMLEGDREEFRLSEKIFTPLMKTLILVPCWRKYRPVKDTTVAKAMINADHENESDYMVYEANMVFLLASLN